MNKLFTALLLAAAVTHAAHAQDNLERFKTSQPQYGFIENKGQVKDQDQNPNPSVKYILPLPGNNVVLKATGFSYDTYITEEKEKRQRFDDLPDHKEIMKDISFKHHRVDVEFVGANRNPQIVSEGMTNEVINYYVDGSYITTHSYNKVTYKDIYPGIDVEFLARPGEESKPIEYNFIVHPGADMNTIQLKYTGAGSNKLVNNKLELALAHGKLSETIPASYWQKSGEAAKIQYKQITSTKDHITVGFSSESNNKATHQDQALIIDPAPSLEWGTYYGGSGWEVGYNMATDNDGNIFVTGYTISNSSIATAATHQATLGGAYDAFIVKFNFNGERQWATYYGGSEDDEAFGIALDPSGNILITGRTRSTSSIATSAAHQHEFGGGYDEVMMWAPYDIFVAKFNSSGLLQWATYYGDDGDDWANSIATDAFGNVFITGMTLSDSSISTTASTLNGSSDAFIVKFNSNGVRQWGTYFGGLATDQAYSIACDAFGNIYISGITNSNSSIATPGVHQGILGGQADGFIAKFTPSGSLSWGSYYGGAGVDGIYDLAVDLLGNIVIAGSTNSASSIASSNGHQSTFAGGTWYRDTFVAKINSDGTTRQWGTYYGTADDEGPGGIITDTSGNIYVCGTTDSAAAYYFKRAFIIKYDPVGTLQWATEYGGGAGIANQYTMAFGIALDTSANPIITGFTGCPASIASPGVHQPTYAGGGDMFLSKFSPCSTQVSITVPTCDFCEDPAPSRCQGAGTTQFSAVATNAYSVEWAIFDDFNQFFMQLNAIDTEGLVTWDPSYYGETTVRVTAYGCGGPVTQTKVIMINQPGASAATCDIQLQESQVRCQGAGTTQVTAATTNASSFDWSISSDSSEVSNSINAQGLVTWHPDFSGEATITLTVIGCGGDTVTCSETITVLPKPTVTATQDVSICPGDTTSIAVTGSAVQYSWDLLGSGEMHTVNPPSTTTYIVTGTDSLGCQATDDVIVTVHSPPSASITPQLPVVCEGASKTLTASGGVSYQWTHGVFGSTITVKPDSTTQYKVIVTDGNGCSVQDSTVVTVDTSCPPPPEGLRAAALSTAEIKLTWTNQSTTQTSLHLQRKTEFGSFQQVAVLSGSLESYTDEGLAPATKYIYRILAVKNDTESDPSNEDDETTFSYDHHFVRETSVLAPDVTNASLVPTLPVGERIHTWNYLDGEARPLQQVMQQYSPAQNDVIQPFQYDPLGRQAKQHLPYTISSGTPGGLRIDALGEDGEQRQFYEGTTTPAGVPEESSNPYGETEFEPSPLSRVKKQSGPGAEWSITGTRNVKTSYGKNISNEVLVWVFNGTSITASAFYNEGELIKVTQTDEENNSVVTYTDKFGRTVLQKSLGGVSGTPSTYSIYDVNGKLTHQLSPLAVVKALSVSGFPKELLAEDIEKLCFTYTYDSRLRLKEKKTPGISPVCYVYDPWGRIVLTQDGRQRQFDQWTCSKYDAYNRVILTGVITDTRSRDDIQAALDAATQRFESRTDNPGNFHGYTNLAFPTVIDTVFSVTYFDDYSFISTQVANTSFNYRNDALTGLPSQPFLRIQGQATGTKTRVLGTNDFLWTVSYYDEDYRTIQTVGSNHLGGIDRSSVAYNFPGWVTKNNLIHFEDDSLKERTITRRYEYDHAGRLLKTFHTLDEGAEMQLSSLVYNELGQVIKKNIHVEQEEAKQSVDYAYNIRGWLTGINTSTIDSTDLPDHFAMELAYNTEVAGSQPRYDGFISAAKWKEGSNANEQLYQLQYDNLGRLSGADYKANINGAGWAPTDLYSENNLTYDLNGNIKTLDRYTSVEDAVEDIIAEKIDQLQYDYGTSEGNQLLKVTDNASGLRPSLGFDDGNTVGNDYAYDVNGNLIQDLNKGITYITYNTFNLPERAVFSDSSYIEYDYDASGTRLSQTYYTSGDTLVVRTDYVGEFIYVNGQLQKIFHDEGCITVTPYGPEYHYYLNDHLGSTRVVFRTHTEANSAVATMETSQAAEELSEFLYYDEAVKVNFEIFDHTDNDTTHYALRLAGTTNERTGLAKSLSVMPGDTMKMEVFAKYLDPGDNWGFHINSLINAIAQGTADPGVFVDGGAPGTTGGQLNPYASLLGKDDEEPTTAPKAYLNYLLFDRNFNFIDLGYARVSEAAREDSTDVPHERLYLEVVVKEAGYIYIVLSNENETPVDVFFDDFRVEHIESPVVQVNGYYPYGLATYTWVREDETFTNYLFQGKEYDSLTGWHDFHARQYDAALGRWFAVDPANQFMSPYAAMGNNPLVGIDPDGRFVFTALSLIIPGGQVFLPFAIGADLGMWSGGTIANGTSNPFKWDYSSGRTWGYMAGGAITGGLSGGAANTVAMSGIPFANTAAIAAGSFINSFGTFLYAGGKTDVSIGLGAASYNINQNEWGYFGKKENSVLQNIGYGLGALANLQDMVAGFNGTNVEVNSADTKKPNEWWGHSSVTDNTGNINISVGPNNQVSKNTAFNLIDGKVWDNYATDPDTWKVSLNNVNSKILTKLSNNIAKGKGLYGAGNLRWNLLGFSCVSHASRSLLAVGIPTLPINLHPLVLNFQLSVRQAGITYNHYLINNYGY